MIDGYTFSKHALGRLLDMGVEPDEIRECLTNPDEAYRPRSYAGTTNYVRGRLALSVNDHGNVITALWSTRAAWLADAARPGFESTGRSIRDLPYLPDDVKEGL